MIDKNIFEIRVKKGYEWITITETMLIRALSETYPHLIADRIEVDKLLCNFIKAKRYRKLLKDCKKERANEIREAKERWGWGYD